jgi:FkbM family methyltransferase
MLASLLRSFFSSRPAAAGTPAGAAREVAGLDGPFAQELAAFLRENLKNVEGNNVDEDRFLGERDLSLRYAKYRAAMLRELAQAAAEYGAVRDSFADATSRGWYLQLIAYRLLGPDHVRLPSNSPEHWAIRERVKALSSRPIAGICGELSDYSVDFAGERIDLQAWWSNIAWTFHLRQYHYSRDGITVSPRSGDRVIDAGACFGDTALAFAALVGPSGRVVSLEIEPDNARVARANIARNPGLAGRIRLRECALAHAIVPLYLHGSGTAARVGEDASAHPLEVTTIDRLVDSGELDRVDFIKMDIEGAERYALAGAQQALRRFRPRLAISIYHTPADLRYIARWIDALGLGYRFHLDHYTIHAEETVLYATAG